MKVVKKINKIKQPNLKINSYTLKGFFLQFFTSFLIRFINHNGVNPHNLVYDYWEEFLDLGERICS